MRIKNYTKIVWMISVCGRDFIIRDNLSKPIIRVSPYFFREDLSLSDHFPKSFLILSLIFQTSFDLHLSAPKVFNTHVVHLGVYFQRRIPSINIMYK